MRKPAFDNQHGLSLIELMIAVGVMLATILAFATMINSQSKEVRGITERLTSAELSADVRRYLDVQTICTDILTNNTVNATVPFTIVNPATDVFTLNVVRASPAITIAAVGEAPSPNVPSYVISSIQLRNFTLLSPGKYQAELRFNPVQNQLVRPLNFVSYSPIVTVDAGNVITGCTDASPLGPPPLAPEVFVPANGVNYPKNHTAGRRVDVIYNLALVQPANSSIAYAFVFNGAPLMQWPGIPVNNWVAVDPTYFHSFISDGTGFNVAMTWGPAAPAPNPVGVTHATITIIRY